MSAQKLQCLQNRLARAVTLKTDFLQQPRKETTNLGVVIAKVLVVVVVILATQSGDGCDVSLQLLSRDSRKNSGA